jgi:hypothetical protein
MPGGARTGVGRPADRAVPPRGMKLPYLFNE